MRDEQRSASPSQRGGDVLAGIIGCRRARTGLDDLGVVDALQVNGGDTELAVAELALDDDQRDAFAGELDGVGMPELVGREAPPDPRVDGGPAQVRSCGGARPVPTARRTVDDAE
jgi:hypothetical protein